MSDNVKLAGFVDSNIWLYVFPGASAEPYKFNIAKELISNSNHIISIQVVNEVCVNLIRKAKFSEEKIRDVIQAFFDNYIVVGLTQQAFLKASQLREDYRLSYWDSLIIACALENDMAVVYSEDMQNGLLIEGKLKIVNPFV